MSEPALALATPPSNAPPIQTIKERSSTDIEKIYVGGKTFSVQISDWVNTSKVPLANEETVIVDGKAQQCGYCSFSSLDCYRKCHYKYFLKYVEKVHARLRPALNLWGGSAIHEATEKLLKAKIENTPMGLEAYLSGLDAPLQKEIDSFKAKFLKEKEGGYDPMELTFEDKEGKPMDPTLIFNQFRSAASAFYQASYANVKPISVEKPFVFSLDFRRGGKVPVMGWIDVIEEYNGEPMVTDHKSSDKKWTQERVNTNQQLTIYSMAEKVPNVSINNFLLGSPKGKRSGEFLKLFDKKTIKDYEDTCTDLNGLLVGIKEGVFPKTGMANPQVCSSTQCEYFGICLG